MIKNNIELDRFYSHKRATKSLKRTLREAKEARAKFEKEADLIRSFGRQSKVIELLARKQKSSLKVKKNALDITLGKTFSLVDNPEEVIQILTKIAKTLYQNPKIREINFLYAQLENYDLAANALLDLIAYEKKMEYRSKLGRKQLRLRGHYPLNHAVKKFIKAMGIIKHMDVKHELLHAAEKSTIKFFDARNYNYYYSGSVNAEFKDLKVESFVDHINECLQARGYELSIEGRANLSNYTGEIIGNAEDHSKFRDWTIQSYMDMSLEKPYCEIAIFNFGLSIAETFKGLDSTHYTWGHIGKYILTHRGMKLFSHTWREEDLLTVVALQAHVSTKNQSDKDSRGQGTIDIIRFFQDVHRKCTKDGRDSKMTLVSGSTWIHFDGTYSLTERAGQGAIIPFNSEQSLNHRPDPRYVRSLGQSHFPGTIISIKFPIELSSDLVSLT